VLLCALSLPHGDEITSKANNPQMCEIPSPREATSAL